MASNVIQRLRSLLTAAVLLCLLSWPQPQAAGRMTVRDQHVLVLGRISDDPKAHYEQLKPLLDYVIPRMAGVGIREGRILMARDAQQMTSYLRRGRVDWVTETSGIAMQLAQRAAARPLLLTERDGVSSYRTVFLARRDAGIDDLQMLRARSIAFQNTSSTSAYFVPAAEILARGLPLSLLLSPHDRADDGTVGYVFARSELNVSTWVHKRLVDAGVMSNLDWNNPTRVPPSYKRDLVIFHQSGDYPRALEMVRGDLKPEVRERLAQVLREASQDPDAREAMLRFFKTTRFLPIDAEAQRALERLGTGVARVRADVE